MPCISPECAYCPACRYGRVEIDDCEAPYHTDVNWICTLTPREYERIKDIALARKFAKEIETAYDNINKKRGI